MQKNNVSICRFEDLLLSVTKLSNTKQINMKLLLHSLRQSLVYRRLKAPDMFDWETAVGGRISDSKVFVQHREDLTVQHLEAPDPLYHSTQLLKKKHPFLPFIFASAVEENKRTPTPRTLSSF